MCASPTYVATVDCAGRCKGRDRVGTTNHIEASQRLGSEPRLASPHERSEGIGLQRFLTRMHDGSSKPSQLDVLSGKPSDPLRERPGSLAPSLIE